jgi:ubiquinone/menaquinone biosynthesis C-methylase UbiE
MTQEKRDFDAAREPSREKRDFDTAKALNGEKRDFDTAAATWDNNPTRVKLAGDVARAIRETVPLKPGMVVLDFGCGTGLLTLQIRPQVGAITGMDSSEGMLAALDGKVRSQGLERVSTCLMDPERDGMPAGQYDLVVSSMTFHHIPDIREMLTKLAGVIRPGGYIAIADLDKDDGKFHESPEGVFHNGFDRSIMKKHFEAAGFAGVRNRTAAIVRKASPSGGTNTFTVFLMTGRKPA